MQRNVEEVKVSEKLETYREEAVKIANHFNAAEQYAIQCTRIIADKSCINVTASKEMYIFFENLILQIDRLKLFYRSAAQYIENTYQSLENNK